MCCVTRFSFKSKWPQWNKELSVQCNFNTSQSQTCGFSRCTYEKGKSNGMNFWCQMVHFRLSQWKDIENFLLVSLNSIWSTETFRSMALAFFLALSPFLQYLLHCCFPYFVPWSTNVVSCMFACWEDFLGWSSHLLLLTVIPYIPPASSPLSLSAEINNSLSLECLAVIFLTDSLWGYRNLWIYEPA